MPMVSARIGKTNGMFAPAAALQLTGVLRGGVGLFRFNLTEVGNRNAAFRKMRHDFERATHGLNETPQIADVHICPVFHNGSSRCLCPCGTGWRHLRTSPPRSIRSFAPRSGSIM